MFQSPPPPQADPPRATWSEMNPQRPRPLGLAVQGPWRRWAVTGGIHPTLSFVASFFSFLNGESLKNLLCILWLHWVFVAARAFFSCVSSGLAASRRARALGSQGTVAAAHEPGCRAAHGISQTRDRTRVPCTVSPVQSLRRADSLRPHGL